MSVAVTTEQGAPKRAQNARRQLLDLLRLVGGLAVLVIAGIIVSPRARDGSIIFLDQTNLFDILARVSNIGIIAVGMTLVILTGGIDLSVGSVLSLGTVVAGVLLLEHGWTPAAWLAVPALALAGGLLGARLAGSLARGSQARAWVGLCGFVVGALILGALASGQIGVGLPLPLLLLAVMAVGLLVGGVNGTLVSGGGLQPFIATLASMISVWGLAWLIAGEANARRPLPASNHALDAFNWLGSRLDLVRPLVLAWKFLPAWRLEVPVPGLVFLAVVIVAHVTLRYTPLGRRIYAIGGNEDAARLTGVPVTETKVFVYGASGLLSALTGVLWAAQYHQGFPDAGQGAELDAIAAVVIGGTSLMGGRGGVLGTFMGVLMFGVLNNILTLLQYTTNWQRLVTGVIIAVAVLAQEGRVQAAVRRYVGLLRGRA